VWLLDVRVAVGIAVGIDVKHHRMEAQVGDVKAAAHAAGRRGLRRVAAFAFVVWCWHERHRA
jgi:hypothetical protein